MQNLKYFHQTKLTYLGQPQLEVIVKVAVHQRTQAEGRALFWYFCSTCTAEPCSMPVALWSDI